MWSVTAAIVVLGVALGTLGLATAAEDDGWEALFDGSKDKFRTAYKDMPRRGHVGFQDHGKPVWYRNVKVKPLDTATK